VPPTQRLYPDCVIKGVYGILLLIKFQKVRPPEEPERPRIDPVADREDFRCNPLLFRCKGAKIPLLGGAAKSGDKLPKLHSFCWRLEDVFRGLDAFFLLSGNSRGRSLD
jgi:hypothetical protein